MSGVFARFHEPTGLEFYDNAVEIEKAVWRFVKNEKNIPKRAWFSHGLPLYKLARQLLVTITRANSVYPIREQELETRRALQLEAIGINESIIASIRMTVEEIETIDCNKLDGLGQLLIHESDLLRGWRKKSKLLKEKE
jgi:hypothetical protein